MKRIWFCLLGGGICALVCLIGSQIIFGFPGISWETVSMTIANRILLGFVIAIYSWEIKRHWHGALLGLILSFTVSVGFIPGDPLKFFLYTSAGILYGVFIDWFASDVFDAGRTFI